MEQTTHLEQLAEELRNSINQLLLETMSAPLQAAIEQLTHVAKSSNLSPEAKAEMVKLLQSSLLFPFISSTVSIALSTGIELKDVLYFTGEAWEVMRAQHMAQVATEVANKLKQQTKE